MLEITRWRYRNSDVLRVSYCEQKMPLQLTARYAARTVMVTSVIYELIVTK